MIAFFVPEIVKFSNYVNSVTDDVTGCASTVVWHKIKNISANNEAMLLKLGRYVAPYEIYQMLDILLLLWQHARFQSPTSSNWNIREVKLDVYGKRQTANGKNKTFAVCLQLSVH